MIQSFEDITKLSKVLKEKVKDTLTDKNEIYELLDSVDDLIIVWCKNQSCLYSQILQGSLGIQANDKDKNDNIQCLKLSKPPFQNIRSIKLNKNGTGVLLTSSEGVAVVELPKRWGNPSLFDGGEDTIICRVEFVGEQFYFSNKHLKVIASEWHPGSLDQSSITVLSSDNYLRIYSLSHLEIPEVAIGVQPASRNEREGGKFGVRDSAVAFGFGVPVAAKDRPDSSSFVDATSSSELSFNGLEAIEKEKLRLQDLLWPVFILLNNGDVYYTLTALSKRNLYRRVLYGPLNMLPSSFDNYGVDFCSLLVLPSSPTVLVIGNVAGMLHHCIVVEGTAEVDAKNEQEDSVLNITEAVNSLSLEPASFYLHVYESVRLDLAYSPSSPLSALGFFFRGDALSPSRYLVCYPEGCHAVLIPLVERFLTQGCDIPEADLESRVEHLICTRPVSSPVGPVVIGVCFTPSGKILVHLDSGAVEKLSLSLSFVSPLPEFRFDGQDEGISSAARKQNSFEEHIRSILRRNASQPVILTSGVASCGQEVSPEEKLNLLQRTTYTLRENYVRPLVKAREEIKRRHQLLLDQKNRLKHELNQMQCDRRELADKSRDLAEKYEAANEKNSLLMRRLEYVIGSIVRKMPRLSSSEKRMLDELAAINDKIPNLKNQIELIESKSEWQQNQVEKDRKNISVRQAQLASISDNQLACLKMSLGKESDKLKNLTQKIIQLKEMVDGH